MSTSRTAVTNIADARVEIPSLLTWRGAAQALGGDKETSRWFVDKLASEGSIDVVRLGPGIVRFTAESILRYIESARFPKSKAS